MFACVERLAEELRSGYSGAALPEDFEIEPEPCPPEFGADLTVNCFSFASALRRNPMEIAAFCAEKLSVDPEVDSARTVKAFVNVWLNPAALHRDTAGNPQMLMPERVISSNEKKRIVIEYSAPNTNKPLHLGHVRNNALGMGTCSLLSRAGHDVVPVNLVNDRGIHICKSMLAYLRFGGELTPESEGIKGDHFVGDFYVRFNKALEEQLQQLRKEDPENRAESDEDLFLETEIGRAAQGMLRKWEDGDPEVMALWAKMNRWVLKGFDQTYARMGVKFKKTYYESETYILGKDVVEKGLQNGVFIKKDDGVVVADLEDEKLGEKVVLRSDGTSVYITQDMGTTVRKAEDFDPDSQVWVVGDEQILHFRMLFTIMKKLGYQWADDLTHLAYGMVNLPSGKMKSREGTVVDADKLFDEMHGLAKSATLERCGDDVPEDIELRSEIIAMGALKFMLLKFNPRTTIMFDPEASVKFEGDTGPYVQYACARINSIERKAAERDLLANPGAAQPAWELLSSREEKDVSLCLSRYPQTLRTAAEKMDCSALAGYLLDLAKAFNRFYRECPVLNAENAELREARLELSFRIRDVLVDGLGTLTIGVPEAM